MKVLEAKIIYESDDLEKYKKIISDIFYNFGYRLKNRRAYFK